MGASYNFGSFLILSSLILVTHGQRNHLLKYINAGTNPAPSTPPQFSSATLTDDQMRNTRNRFARADIICLDGMWALYNTTDYGEGAEDSTTVISVRGTDIRRCTQAGQIPVLRNVQSIRFLGAANYMEDSIQIYSLPFLLGGLWSITPTAAPSTILPPTGISGFSLGSIASTGVSHFVICGDQNNPCSNGVCVNMRQQGNLFLQRNTARDTSVANGWPKTVRQIMIVTADDCLNYPNPPAINNTRGRSARSAAHSGVIALAKSASA